MPILARLGHHLTLTGGNIHGVIGVLGLGCLLAALGLVAVRTLGAPPSQRSQPRTIGARRRLRRRDEHALQPNQPRLARRRSREENGSARQAV
jgi:hypothetical protein